LSLMRASLVVKRLALTRQGGSIEMFPSFPGVNATLYASL